MNATREPAPPVSRSLVGGFLMGLHLQKRLPFLFLE